MRHIAKLLRRLRILIAPRRFERELDEELSFHLEMQTRWHESQGLDRASARALAAKEFGGEVRFKEAVRDVRGLSWGTTSRGTCDSPCGPTDARPVTP